MIKLNNKVLNVLVNFILTIWQLPQILISLIFLALFRKYEMYTNEYNHITVVNVNKGNLFGGACCSFGPVILTTPNCSETVKRHETGHSKQSLVYGPLFLFVVAIPSVILFWRRRFQNKSHEWYLQQFPENQAESWGGTNKLF